MRSKLSDIQAEALKTRVFIAQETHLFKVREIAKHWDISLSTLIRYNIPEYRELSRLVARKARVVSERSECQICQAKLLGHARCSSCTILIHGEPECSCIDTFPRSKLYI